MRGLGAGLFMPVNEYQLAIISTLTLVGLTFSNSLLADKRKILWSLIIVLISINFHPVALLSLGYIISYEFFESGKTARKHWIIIALSAILIFILKKWLVPFDDYEHNKMKSWSAVFGFLLNPSHLVSASASLRYFFHYFPELILFFFVSCGILAKEKRWLVLLFSVLYSYFILIFFSVIRGSGETSFWFAEYTILFGLPALLPLIKLLTELTKRKIIFPLVISSLIIVFIFRIKTNLSYFQNRINYVERLIQNGSSLPETLHH